MRGLVDIVIELDKSQQIGQKKQPAVSFFLHFLIVLDELWGVMMERDYSVSSLFIVAI